MRTALCVTQIFRSLVEACTKSNGILAHKFVKTQRKCDKIKGMINSNPGI